MISRNTFAAAAPRPSAADGRPLTREHAIETVVRRLSSGALVVCTTGMASRELYEIRERDGGDHSRDCLIVAMGHASQVALGLALGRPEREVICIDGDGAPSCTWAVLRLPARRAPAISSMCC